MDEVRRLRRQIDRVDLELVQLLKGRSQAARFLGEIKRSRGAPLRDPKRENAIIRKMDRLARTLDLDKGHVRSIFRQIFGLAVKAQKGTDHRRRSLDNLHVLVIGGTGGMGRLFAQLARIQGASVKIAGRNQSRTRKTAKEMGLEHGTISDAKTSDVVIVAVPVSVTSSIAIQAGRRMKSGSMLADLSSVKTGIADVTARRIPKQVEYVSLHPLFSPSVNTLSGQNIVAIPFNPGRLWKRLARALTTEGARVRISSVRIHDLAMAHVQVLHHFALMSLGVSLGRWSSVYQTNSLKQTETTITSLLKNWSTVMAIQHLNPFGQSARDNLASTVSQLRRIDPRSERLLRKALTLHVQKWTRKI
ncbi:MAG TPA: prephenate dehydrogenase/arogenate dehydrogenase family protein [Candidatus Bathyarchaeia archaeon]|nr:prephenate dehydrogenase/arogenate dehydrogenase family protein [Candidatus Bathyarchaeia archaeon]